MSAGKRIPEAQKLVILADALVTSAADAAGRWGIRDDTIYGWTKPLGGLRALRELYEMKQVGAIAEMAGAISREVNKRLPQLSPEHVIELALEALRMGKQASGGGGTMILNTPIAQAQARQESDGNEDRVAAILAVLAEAGLLQAGDGNGAAPDGVLPALPDA